MDPNMVAAGTTVPSPMSPQMQNTPCWKRGTDSNDTHIRTSDRPVTEYYSAKRGSYHFIVFLSCHLARKAAFALGGLLTKFVQWRGCIGALVFSVFSAYAP